MGNDKGICNNHDKKYMINESYQKEGFDMSPCDLELSMSIMINIQQNIHYIPFILITMSM
jgi:hypothetical protein